MLRRYKKLLMGAAGGLLALGANSARAGITVTLPNSTPIQAPGYFAGYEQFAYQISLSNQASLQPGSFFTIYDVNGLFNALAPANWTASIGATGQTPSGAPPAFDSASIGNVTFTYNGPAIAGGGTVGGFEVNTNPGFGGTTAGEFGGSALSLGGSDDSSGSVAVPAASAAVPLPSAAYAFPLGLALATLAWRKLRPVA